MPHGPLTVPVAQPRPPAPRLRLLLHPAVPCVRGLRLRQARGLMRSFPFLQFYRSFRVEHRQGIGDESVCPRLDNAGFCIEHDLRVVVQDHQAELGPDTTYRYLPGPVITISPALLGNTPPLISFLRQSVVRRPVHQRPLHQYPPLLSACNAFPRSARAPETDARSPG